MKYRHLGFSEHDKMSDGNIWHFFCIRLVDYFI